MPHTIFRFRVFSFAVSPARLGMLVLGAMMAVVLAPSALTGVKAQQAAAAPSPESQPAAQQPAADQAPQAAPAPPAASQESRPTPSAASSGSQPEPALSPSVSQKAASPFSEPGEITEDEIRRLLVGKQLFLRGGYLDNDLSYNEHGVLVGHSPQGSYTLSGIQIDKVRLTKHKLELEGQRYGLHFLGALPYEDPTKAVDHVNITPKKKVVKITIDRELVVKPREKKEKGKAAKPAPKTAAAPAPTAAPSPAQAPPADATGAGEAQAENAAAPPEDRPADPAVLRQSAVDQKARLVSTFEPPSNQYAQDHGVAGMCLYHVVIGADGKPGEIAVARPIGFGLDESAADSIRKATFQPAIKDGKPVPVMLDLVVEFRIYSKRTAVAPSPGQQPAESSLPGPYSGQHP